MSIPNDDSGAGTFYVLLFSIFLAASYLIKIWIKQIKQNLHISRILSQNVFIFTQLV